MTIQTLISTMNRDEIDFITKMNIETDVVIGNQCEKNKTYQEYHNGHDVYRIDSNTKGLSNNRNITLRNATADICLLADDDLVYAKGYAELVCREFDHHPEADLIIFNLYETPVRRYVTKKTTKVGFLNYMRYGSVRIAFKRKSIYDNKIFFDSHFGAGAEIPMCEDTIFLHECLKKKLKIIAVPTYLLYLTNERESTWFRGFDEKYLCNKGKSYYRISHMFHLLLCLQDVIRHRKKYSETGTITKNIQIMLQGVKEYKRGMNND